MAFPVRDIDEAVAFYHRLLGCPMGRSARKWADFDFFGNQISAHVSLDDCCEAGTNPVDGDNVPARHFGAILDWEEWEALSRKMKDAGVPFIIQPKIRYKGKIGEQGTFFVRDPSGNALEFKTFKNKEAIFAQGGDYDE